jgi:hypothetical protein
MGMLQVCASDDTPEKGGGAGTSIGFPTFRSLLRVDCIIKQLPIKSKERSLLYKNWFLPFVARLQQAHFGKVTAFNFQ